jgi:hypothetical protein
VDTSALAWLTRWYSDGFECGSPPSIAIDTLDNPGWSLKVRLPAREIADLSENTASPPSDAQDWTAVSIRNGRFEGFGGPRRLGKLIARLARVAMSVDLSAEDSTLSHLMTWYATQCDGHWEHECGVRIVTLDTGGWEMVADARLGDEAARSLPKQLMRSATDWLAFELHCDRVVARGGPCNLPEMVANFLSCAASGQES